VSQTSRILRATAVTIGLASVFALVGCSKAGAPAPSSTPLPSGSSALVAPGAKDLPKGVSPLFQQDLLAVTAATKGKLAKEGRYIVAEKPYGPFDTLTEIRFEGGEVGYFVSPGGRPFGSLGMTTAAPADDATAKLSSLPVLEPGSGSQEAAQALFEAYKDKLK